MDEESRLKKAVRFCLGLIAMLVIFAVASLLVHGIAGGMVWTFAKVLPWLNDAGRVAFYICMLVLLPLCIFRKARPWAGFGFLVSSYIFGAFLFAWSCLLDVQLWGYVGLIVGLLLGIVGVVPVALLATLFHGAWQAFWSILFGAILTLVTRSAGTHLIALRKVWQRQEIPV